MSLAQWFYACWVAVVVVFALVGIVNALKAETKGSCALMTAMVCVIVVNAAISMDQAQDLREMRKLAASALQQRNQHEQACVARKDAVVDAAASAINLALEHGCQLPKREYKGLL